MKFRAGGPTASITDSLCWFDDRMLLPAKVAFHLKEAPGTSTELLAPFTKAASNSIKQAQALDRDTSGCVLVQRQIGNRSKFVFRWQSYPRSLRSSFPELPYFKRLHRGPKSPGWNRPFTRKPI
jgi:hypothetical protein